MKKVEIKNNVKIGSWEEVKDLPTSAITHRDEDTSKLDGLIIRGYETKFGASNENGEMYDEGCLDKFIERYFVEKGFNLTVDIQHLQDIQHLCGRVIYCEVNNQGFYFVVYVPRTFVNFETLKNLLEEGIIQGFSKYGFATDYDYDEKKDCLKIKEFSLISVSLVTTPANAVPFEKVAEVKNALRFENKKKNKNEIENFFNN